MNKKFYFLKIFGIKNKKNLLNKIIYYILKEKI